MRDRKHRRRHWNHQVSQKSVGEREIKLRDERLVSRAQPDIAECDVFLGQHLC